MPIIPNPVARPAKATNKDMVEAGVEAASETIALMFLSSLTGTSESSLVTIPRTAPREPRGRVNGWRPTPADEPYSPAHQGARPEQSGPDPNPRGRRAGTSAAQHRTRD